MYLMGVIIGAVAFVVIGVFHPIVVKCQYYFTDRVWPVFLVAGLACCAAALFIRRVEYSAIVAILGFTMLWSIGELKEQTKRVEKGWFPANPNRKDT